MVCQSCNERLPLSARVCFACGAPVASSGPVHSPSGPARITVPREVLPERVRVGHAPIPLLDRPFAAARPILMLEPGQVLRVHSGQLGFYTVETAEGRRGFVEQGAVVAVEPEAGPLPEPPRLSAAHDRPTPLVTPQTGGATAAVPAEVVPQRLKRGADLPHSRSEEKSDLPFNIPMLEGERVRYRAVFLYNPDAEQELVVTNRRLILTGGTIGRLPRVLHLDEIEAVRLQDSGTGSTNGEGHLFITVTGIPGALHVGGVHMPHHVRNEILAAATEARSLPRTEAPTLLIRKRKSG